MNDSISSQAPSRASPIRLVDYGPCLRQGRHAHEFASITLILGGGLKESAGRSTSFAEAGWMCLKAPGVEHECHFGIDATRTLQLKLLPGEFHADDESGLRLPSWQWRPPGPLVAEMLALMRLRRSPLAETRREEISEQIQALLAEFSVEPLPLSPPPWLPRVQRALAEGSESISELANQCGVHRVHLARSFRRHVGLPPARFRRVMRLIRTVNALRRDRDALADVAAAEGYADQSHMIRELRADTGLTPLAWRRLGA